MTTEELLKPRYKVESPFPAMEGYGVYVGDILTDDNIKPVTNQNGKPIVPFEWGSFPLIFRKLKWWEERKLEDLPKYVKCIKTPDQVHKEGEVYKVEWKANDWGESKLSLVILYTNCYEPADI